MSFLVGRLAATEGAYFLQESKHAAGRLAGKLHPSSPPASGSVAKEDAADVLPEILRHNIPIKAPAPVPDPSLSASSRWLLPSSSRDSAAISPDALNPLRSYVSLPPATFGPKRWQLVEGETHYSASTANDLRRDRYPPPMDPEKLKAVMEGYSQIGKAFAVATALVFGGGTLMLTYAARKLELNTADDVRTKVRDALMPRADTFREQTAHLRIWAEGITERWHIEGKAEVEEKPIIIKELRKSLGARTST